MGGMENVRARRGQPDTTRVTVRCAPGKAYVPMRTILGAIRANCVFLPRVVNLWTGMRIALFPSIRHAMRCIMVLRCHCGKGDEWI